MQARDYNLVRQRHSRDRTEHGQRVFGASGNDALGAHLARRGRVPKDLGNNSIPS